MSLIPLRKSRKADHLDEQAITQLQLFTPFKQVLDSRSARPFIKWVGGKQSIAATLIDFFPESLKYYKP